MATWYWEPEFRTIELDRESRVPDEPYPSCDEGEPLAGSLPKCGPAENGAGVEPATPSPSSEDVEQSFYGRDPFGRPDPRTHPEFWTE